MADVNQIITAIGLGGVVPGTLSILITEPERVKKKIERERGKK